MCGFKGLPKFIRINVGGDEEGIEESKEVEGEEQSALAQTKHWIDKFCVFRGFNDP